MPKRNYDNDYPSVTTVLGVLRKIGLEQWFLSNTRAFCTEKSKRGLAIGTEIHDAIQSYIETGKASIDTIYEQEVSIALQSFVKFRKENHELVLERAEIPLTSEVFCFNGTIDCIAGDTMVDWKTGECKDKESPTIYDEWKYQVAAYVKLYNEVHKTNIEKACIVAIGKDKIGYNLCWMDREEIDDCFMRVFIPCLQIYNYQKQQKRKLKEGIFYVK